MSPLSIRCIRAAFLYLAIGIGLGVWFALDRSAGAWLRPLHAALNLWGWVALLIYGMAYHMLPRFSGRPLRRPQLMAAQSWMAIGGVAFTGIGWVGVLAGAVAAQAALVAGGALIAAAAILFALLIGELLMAPARA